MSDLTHSAPFRIRAWLLRHLRLGCVAGLLLAALDLVLMHSVGVAELVGSAPLTAGAKFVAAASTIGLFAALCVALGLVGALGLRRRWSRRLSLTLSSVFATLFVVAHVFGLVVRLMSGSFVTRGGLEFMLGSAPHFLDAALVGYARYTYPLAVLAVGIGVGIALYLRRPTPELPGDVLRHTLPEVVLLASLGPAALFVVAGDHCVGVARSSPELALLASLDSKWERPDDKQPESQPIQADRGPPRSSADRWGQLVATAGESPRAHRPNVLFLMLESVGPAHLGFNGYPRGTTPNLDRIAAQSARFKRVWTTATHSNYAQMALLSSLFPRRGAGLDMYTRLDYPRMLLHDVFYRLKYQVATISSQDETWQGMLRFQRTGTPVEYWHAKDYQGIHVFTGSEHVVPDEETAARAAKYIGDHQGEPWALYVNFQMTHFPYVLPDGAAEPFQPTEPEGPFNYLYYSESDLDVVKNRYDNALRYVDAQIGRLKQALEATGQLRDTIWVITSDHGEAFYQHGGVTHGKTLYDEESRVPLLWHWPRQVAAQDIEAPVSHLDVLPTLLDMVGVPPHPSHQGQSLRRLMLTSDQQAKLPEPPQHPAVFMNIQGIRNADGVVCWPWKLVLERSSRQVMLFNLEADAAERQNRVVQESRVAAELANLLKTQMSAQSRYHRKVGGLQRTQFQPRLLSCPELPDARRAAR